MKFSITYIKYLLAISALCLLLKSCIPEPLEVSGLPTLEPKVVVYSQLIPDSLGIAILLTRSIGALDANDDSDINDLINQIALNDATVWVSDGTATDTLQFLGAGVYASIATNFQAGTEYQLYINSETLGIATSTTKALPQINFDSVQAKLFITDFDSLAQVNFSLTDPLGANFYIVNVQPIENLAEGAASFFNPQIYTYLFTDSAFDGSSYSDEFIVPFQDFSPGDSVLVSLTNISPEYYEFLQLRSDNRYNFNDFGTEPINYPSNVAGGYGFFNLHQADVRLFELEE